eukprot:Rmarinus@m.28710
MKEPRYLADTVSSVAKRTEIISPEILVSCGDTKYDEARLQTDQLDAPVAGVLRQSGTSAIPHAIVASRALEEYSSSHENAGHSSTQTSKKPDSPPHDLRDSSIEPPPTESPRISAPLRVFSSAPSFPDGVGAHDSTTKVCTTEDSGEGTFRSDNIKPRKPKKYARQKKASNHRKYTRHLSGSNGKSTRDSPSESVLTGHTLPICKVCGVQPESRDIPSCDCLSQQDVRPSHLHAGSRRMSPECWSVQEGYPVHGRMSLKGRTVQKSLKYRNQWTSKEDRESDSTVACGLCGTCPSCVSCSECVRDACSRCGDYEDFQQPGSRSGFSDGETVCTCGCHDNCGGDSSQGWCGRVLAGGSAGNGDVDSNHHSDVDQALPMASKACEKVTSVGGAWLSIQCH